MSWQYSSPPLNFDAALRHFQEANQRASELDEENEAAASYQELIVDNPSYLDRVMQHLVDEQRATTEELAGFIEPDLYSRLAERQLALTDRLSEVPAEQAAELNRLNEEEARIDRISDEALAKHTRREDYDPGRVLDFINSVIELKKPIIK